MTLKHQYDSQDAIPEQYRELYSEKSGKWEITGISGLATQANVSRLETALTKERNDHKATKEKWAPFAELGSIDDVHAKLDKIPELEAAAKGKLDEAQIEEIVQRRVEGTIRSKIAPLERQIGSLTKERDEYRSTNEKLSATETRRQLSDALRPHLVSKKVRPEHYDDVEMWAERQIAKSEDGQFVTRDNIGITPGLNPADWLDEMLTKRPGWVPGSKGGGATGSGSTGNLGSNPFSHDNWNVTEQMRFTKAHGMEKATQAAAAHGTTPGGPRPQPKG